MEANDDFPLSNFDLEDLDLERDQLDQNDSQPKPQPESAEDFRLTLARFNKRLRFLKVLLVAGGLHQGSSVRYRRFLRVVCWMCTAFCLAQLVLHSASYRNPFFDLVLTLWHAWVLIGFEVWCRFLATPHWKNLMKTVTAQQREKFSAQLNRFGMLGLISSILITCGGLIAWVGPMLTMMVNNVRMNWHDGGNVGVYVFNAAHAALFIVILFPWLSLYVSQVILFHVVTIAHKADIDVYFSTVIALFRPVLAPALHQNTMMGGNNTNNSGGPGTGHNSRLLNPARQSPQIKLRILASEPKQSEQASILTVSPASSASQESTDAESKETEKEPPTSIPGTPDRAARTRSLRVVPTAQHQSSPSSGPAATPLLQLQLSLAAAQPKIEAASAPCTARGLNPRTASFVAHSRHPSDGNKLFYVPASTPPPPTLATTEPLQWAFALRKQHPLRERLTETSAYFQWPYAGYLMIGMLMSAAGAANLNFMILRLEPVSYDRVIQDLAFLGLGLFTCLYTLWTPATLPGYWEDCVHRFTRVMLNSAPLIDPSVQMRMMAEYSRLMAFCPFDVPCTSTMTLSCLRGGAEILLAFLVILDLYYTHRNNL